MGTRWTRLWADSRPQSGGIGSWGQGGPGYGLTADHSLGKLVHGDKVDQAMG